METREIAARLATRLASHTIPDEALLDLAQRLTPGGRVPVDADICVFGICVDYMIERDGLVDVIRSLQGEKGIGAIRVFPKGIIAPELLVQVEHALDRTR